MLSKLPLDMVGCQGMYDALYQMMYGSHFALKGRDGTKIAIIPCLLRGRHVMSYHCVTSFCDIESIVS